MKTGALAPCQPEVVNFLLNLSSIEKSDTVVEFGPGTGVYTGEILKRIRPGTTFFAIEINPEFHKATKKAHPEAEVYLDSAENVAKYLEMHGKTTCDSIISTLPWAVMDKKTQVRIINEVLKVLRPGGEFLTIAYAAGKNMPGGRKFRKLLKEKFPDVYISGNVKNKYFPMFVYRCRKATEVSGEEASTE